MKKIIITLILMISLVTFASAKMTPERPEGYNHIVEVHIREGWNLVLTPDFPLDENDDFMSDSDVKEGNIKAAYLYIPQHNKYYELHPNSDELLNVWSSFSNDRKLYLSGASAWVYSDKSGFMRYRRIDVPRYNQFKLTSGWNFVTLLPGLKQKKLSQFKGDCEILKIAWFGNSEWSVLDPQSILQLSGSDIPSSWNDLIIADSDSDVGKGVLMKMADSCQFGSGPTISPPPIPT